MLYFMRVLSVALALLIVTGCSDKDDDDNYAEANGTALDFRIALVRGGTFDAGSRLGSVVLVNFWDTWCVPCRLEQWDLNQLFTEFHDDGLEIVGVAIAHDGIPTVAEYLTEFEVEYISGLTGQSVEAIFGVPSGIPKTYLINRSGEIAYVQTGMLDYDHFAEMITHLLEN